MSSCSTSMRAVGGCCGLPPAFDGASPTYKRVLAAVIAINLTGFAVVAVGSWLANSASLAANTLDFAADAATYGLSLWAIGKTVAVRSAAALVKGASLAVMALGILGFAIWRAVVGLPPQGVVITRLGLFGAATNLVAALLLIPQTALAAQVSALKVTVLSTMLAEPGLGEWGYAALVEVDGRKISGTGGAFDGDALMYQGTLLIRFDVEKMLRVLRIPAEKLSDKAIASARERVANLADLLGHVPEQERVRECLAQSFAEEFGVRFQRGELSAGEESRYRIALAEIDSEDWVRLLDRPQSQLPLVAAVQKFPGGLVRAGIAYERARDRIRQVFFTGDFFVQPKRAMADLEACLRDTDAARLEENITSFFQARSVDMQGLAPADLLRVAQAALRQARAEAVPT